MSDRLGQTNVWTCDSDGSNPAQLTFFQGLTGTPKWSPDGKYLCFDSAAEDNWEIYVISSAGGVPRNLTNNRSDDFLATWGQNGMWIYFTSDRSGEYQIWRVPFAGGIAVQITEKGGACAVEAFDGKSIFYMKDPFRSAIWKMSLEGEEETCILDRELGWGSWLLAEDYIYLKIMRPEGAFQGKQRLLYELPFWELLDLQSGKITELDPWQVSRHPYNANISPDGMWMLFESEEHARIEADIMLVENFR